ncbi:mirror-image polydactyly gene 1 protein [Discoglossus pictus]
MESLMEGGDSINENKPGICIDLHRQGQRGPKSMPIPSPRHFSGHKSSREDQSDIAQSSDIPASPHNSSCGIACTLERGEPSLAATAKELDYLRRTNKELQEALMDRDLELETLRLDMELQEQLLEARIAEKTADLVEELYSTQLVRDEAMMARLRLANEERDEALLQVQQLQLYLEELEDRHPEEGNTTLQELLGRFEAASGSAAMHKNGELILEFIQKSRERKEHITAKEMGAVIQERDSAQTQTLQELLGRFEEASGSAAIHKNGELILEFIQKSREHITAEEMGAVTQERDSARAQTLQELEEASGSAAIHKNGDLNLEHIQKSREHITAEEMGADIQERDSAQTQTLQELLGRFEEASGSAAIHKNGELILEFIQKSRERKEHITAKEMGAVIQERDSARAQCKHLEKELHLLRESKQTSADIVTAQRTFEPPSKAQMTFLQNDHDKVIENYKKLEEELQTLRLYYSLHQSLTQEVNLKEQYSRAITIYEDALRNREELLSITQQQNQQLCVQLQKAQGQNAEIQEALQRATASHREAQEKIHTMERLVNVLRKKIGAGNV